MKVIAIIDNDAYDKKLLVEVTASEMEAFTGLDKEVFKKNNTKELVNKEYDVTSILAANKLVQNFALGEEYNSILANQKSLVKTMEKLQKPMASVKEQLKQVK